MKKVLIVFLLAGFSYTAFPDEKSLYIFGNSSYLQEKQKIYKNTIEIPSKTSLKDIYITITDENCRIFSLEKEKKKHSQIKDLQNQLKEKELQLEKEKYRLKLLDKLPVSLENINQLTDLYSKTNAKIRNLKKQISQLKEKIKALSLKESLKIYYQCLNNKNPEATILYPVNIFPSQEYNIEAFPEKEIIKIKNVLYLKNNSDLSLDNVSLYYFKYIKSPFVSPPKFFIASKIVKGYKGPSYKETGYKSYFYLEDISIKAGEEKIFFLSDDAYKATCDTYIKGKVSSVPFVRCIFIPKKNYPPSEGKIFLKNMYIGKEFIEGLEKGKKAELFFGEDFFISVKKEKIKDFSEKTLFGKIKRTVLWRYTVKNNHKNSINLTIEDKLPVSHSEEIKISYKSGIKWKEFKPDGTVIWSLKLKSGENFSFVFGFIEERREKINK